MAFIQDRHIPWVWGSGRRNIEIQCPKCHDGSFKLGLALGSSVYGCWKNKEHSGSKPEYLIMSLTRCTFDEAKDFARQYFDGKIEHKRCSIKSDAKPCSVPLEFTEFDGNASDMPFMVYCAQRGLDPSYIIPRFQLRVCQTGKFQNRLIIPVIENYHWHTWVGRAITPDQLIRYKAAGHKETENKIADYLGDIDNLIGGELLMLVEGFFDQAAIAQAFIPGVAATAVFGKQLSAAQLYKLIQIAPRYKTIALGYDRSATDVTVKIANQLKWYISNPIKRIIPDAKDWSDSTRDQIRSNINPCLSY